MRLIVAIIAVVACVERKVPPRHPLGRLNRLNLFAAEWCNDNLNEKAAANWVKKFDKNVERLKKRFEQCGFYDDNLQHGGPRERREDDDLAFLDCEGKCPRYEKTKPVGGIKEITNGFATWAQRYVAECKLQPHRQISRSTKWFNQLKELVLINKEF